jgi:hypothetical protein
MQRHSKRHYHDHAQPRAGEWSADDGRPFARLVRHRLTRRHHKIRRSSRLIAQPGGFFLLANMPISPEWQAITFCVGCGLDRTSRHGRIGDAGPVCFSASNATSLVILLVCAGIQKASCRRILARPPPIRGWPPSWEGSKTCSILPHVQRLPLCAAPATSSGSGADRAADGWWFGATSRTPSSSWASLPHSPRSVRLRIDNSSPIRRRTHGNAGHVIERGEI